MSDFFVNFHACISLSFLVCLVFGHHKQEITVVKGFGKKTRASLNPRKWLDWTREEGGQDPGVLPVSLGER